MSQAMVPAGPDVSSVPSSAELSARGLLSDVLQDGMSVDEQIAALEAARAKASAVKRYYGSPQTATQMRRSRATDTLLAILKHSNYANPHRVERPRVIVGAERLA